MLQVAPADAPTLAFGFRPLVAPRTRYALLATLIACTLQNLIVGAPYAANERTNGASPALRGLIVAILLYFGIGPTSLLSAPTLVRGGFHLRFLLSLPITLGVGVGVACIPIDSATPGMISIFLLAYGLAYILCILLLSAPLYATDEHKALQRSLGLPVLIIVALFFGLITVYVTLTRMHSSPLLGLLLPSGSAIVRVLGLFALVRSCHTFYYEPKQRFISQLPPSAFSQANLVPPLLGDIEMQYGFFASMFALIIGNASSVATLVEVMLAPGSRSWVLSLAASALLEVPTRTGMLQRVELRVAGRLAAQFGLQWPVSAVHTDALELVYLRSLGGTGYVASTMAICIGCLRAATFGDPAAIVWLDVSPTVRWVLVAQIAFGVFADATVWAVEKGGLQHFELSARFAADHPLSNTAFRDFSFTGYAVTFGFGCMFIYVVFVGFLGPAFVTGTRRDFAPNATDIWVVRVVECTKATLVANFTNVTLPLMLR
jgi:hypothetical protein